MRVVLDQYKPYRLRFQFISNCKLLTPELHPKSPSANNVFVRGSTLPIGGNVFLPPYHIKENVLNCHNPNDRKHGYGQSSSYEKCVNVFHVTRKRNRFAYCRPLLLPTAFRCCRHVDIVVALTTATEQGIGGHPNFHKSRSCLQQFSLVTERCSVGHRPTLHSLATFGPPPSLNQPIRKSVIIELSCPVALRTLTGRYGFEAREEEGRRDP